MNRSTPYPPHGLGRRGEELAARRFVEEGWVVRARGYRWRRKEVDLIVERDGVVAFVEVKTRSGSGSGYGRPEEAVTRRKRAEIEAVARAWLRDHGGSGREVRFDVVAIEMGPDRRVERFDHFRDAWRPGWR